MGEPYKNIHADIIERCRRGDRYAQNRLYSLYAKAMFNTCLRIVGEYKDAEDVLQEAFISAFKNLNTYKGEAAFGAWLKKIVVNKSINFIKKKKIEWMEIGEERVVEDENPAGFMDAGDNLTVDRIKNAMKKLPAGYRAVFSLYLIEGYDHAEIAEILNISTSTSKSQFNRSKKKIREILKSEMAYG